MKIKYLGPSQSVTVIPYGRHLKNKVKDYPDDFGEKLMATSVRQQFEAVDDGVITQADQRIAAMTVPQLTALCKELEIEVPTGARKADLVALIEENTAEPPEGE
jgi:hypothetical protein